MPRFLSDENFNGDIIRGLLIRRPDIDLIRSQDIGLLGFEDPEVLAWAAEHNRILLSHDRTTMPDFAYVRAVASQPMPGVFIINDRHPTGQVIEELLLIDACSVQEEWSGRVLFLPL